MITVTSIPATTTIQPTTILIAIKIISIMELSTNIQIITQETTSMPDNLIILEDYNKIWR